MELTEVQDDEDDFYNAGYKAFGDGASAPTFHKDEKISENVRRWMEGWSDAFLDSIEESKYEVAA